MSTSIDLKGTIIYIGDIIEKGKFIYREFVLKTDDPEYPQDIKFQVIKTKFDILEGKAEGSRVVVSYNLKGRAWVSPQGETKYFNSVEGWRIEKSDGQDNQSTQQTKSAEPQAVTQDDLPF